MGRGDAQHTQAGRTCWSCRHLSPLNSPIPQPREPAPRARTRASSAGVEDGTVPPSSPGLLPLAASLRTSGLTHRGLRKWKWSGSLARGVCSFTAGGISSSFFGVCLLKSLWTVPPPPLFLGKSPLSTSAHASKHARAFLCIFKVTTPQPFGPKLFILLAFRDLLAHHGCHRDVLFP